MGNTVLLEIRCAFPADMISAMAHKHIRFQDLQQIDAQTIRIMTASRNVSPVVFLAEKTCAEVRIVRRFGVLPVLRAMGVRVLYPMVLISTVLLVFWLQGHVWFFSIQGNQTISDLTILQALEQHGVRFGTRTGSIQTNQIKNEMLSDIPSLQWITIIIKGGCAQIVVQERHDKPVISREVSPANITARKDGVIEEISAVNGQQVASPGDVVHAGDLLISGVLDLERITFLTRASGEVFARTWSQADVLLPDNRLDKRYTGRSRTLYSLTVGKNTINFYKTSGISYQEYDKIKYHTELTLPNGLSLPISWNRIVLREYITQPESLDQDHAEALLCEAFHGQLLQDLQAGQILKEDTLTTKVGGSYYMKCQAECREEIGITKDIQD